MYRLFSWEHSYFSGKARAYLRKISSLAHAPVELVSVGPDRNTTIAVTDPWETLTR